jgi:hypothetical protein
METKEVLSNSPLDPHSADNVLDADERGKNSAFPKVAPEYARVWQAWLDDKLSDWERNPAQFDEEGFAPPSKMSLEKASQIARNWRDRTWEAPERIVPNGEGGIVLEWRAGPDAETVEIDAIGEVETISYRDCRVRHRFRA